MAANSLEVILSRQLADSLSIPIFIIDPIGDLVFYNEPAEEILGQRFEETGRMAVENWSTIFKQVDENGDRIPPERLPLVQTLRKHAPHHGEFWIENLAGDKYKISVTAYPIIGRPNRFLGAVAIFWKSENQ